MCAHVSVSLSVCECACVCLPVCLFVSMCRLAIKDIVFVHVLRVYVYWRICPSLTRGQNLLYGAILLQCFIETLFTEVITVPFNC